MKSKLSLIAILAVAGMAAILAGCNAAAAYHKYDNDTEVPRMELEQAKKEYDAGSALFVDARAKVTYDQEHITGSIDVPYGSTPEVLAAMPKGRKIIVYCS